MIRLYIIEYLENMTTLMHCRLLGDGQHRLQYCPFPGPIGQHIQQHYSQEAWSLWLNEQTKLLNEEKLNPLDPSTKARVTQAMSVFFRFDPSV